jgi:hypothetical protein
MSNAQYDEILTQLKTLNAKIAHLEEMFLLVPDVFRYKKLQKDLAEGEWFEADLETLRIILDVSGKTQENLKPEDILTFSLDVLKVIDQLWLEYSNDRFGFSLQLKAYQNLGGNKDTTISGDRKLLEKWGEQLGWRQKNQWRKCDELDYSLNAPLGCHPSQWWNSPYGSKMTHYFLSRLMDCRYCQG